MAGAQARAQVRRPPAAVRACASTSAELSVSSVAPASPLKLQSASAL
jgi:hypothetical protein